MATNPPADDIPPTEPTTATATKPKPAAKGKAKPLAITTRTKVEGSALVPDLSKRAASVARRFWYWIGVTPESPCDQIQVVGVGFCKVTEDVSIVNGKTRRLPVIGQLVQLGEGEIKRLRERLPRTVMRMLPDKDGAEVREEPGTGLNLGDAFIRKRRGHLITIPREEDAKAIEAQGRSAHRYEQGPYDQPAARYMFAQLCEDQENPRVGTAYPETLETTGLEWPGELKD